MKTKGATSFDTFLQQRKKRVETLLQKNLQALARGGTPKKLATALKYVVLGGGKRVRPILVYAIGEAYGVNPKLLDAPACAIEMIHAFSLVHDDLPAMDNDNLRHGKPTCHLAFDEATAILVGDVLAIRAFQILTVDQTLSATKKILMNNILAEASGPHGMAGGQYLDLHLMGTTPSKNQLKKMYLLKTGALISAAVKLGGIAADINQRKLKLLEQFALNLGLAFQIQDDILNIESTAAILGKNVGTDSAQNKITYPAVVGIKAAKTEITKLMAQAQKSLKQLKINDKLLQDFISYIMQRRF